MRHDVYYLALRCTLLFHNICYRLAGRLAIKSEGIHPKHRIIQYEQWFMDHIEHEDVLLDIGSNTGIMPAIFATKANYVYGVEINAKHVFLARKERGAANLEFIHADATKYNYSNLKPISVITLSNVLEHIQDRVAFLKNLIDRVNWRDDNVKLIIRVPCLDRDWLTPLKKEMGIEWRLDKTHYTEYTEEQFREELLKAGIVPLSISVRFGEIYSVCKLSRSLI